MKLIGLLVTGAIGFVSLQILVFWLNAKTKEKIREQEQEKRKQQQREKRAPKVKKEVDQPEEKLPINYDAIIANSKKPEVYTEVVELFKNAMKLRALSREQILYIKKILNECIPAEHRALYKIAYKNDGHEIYCKLKSSFVDEETYQRLKSIITMCIDTKLEKKLY